MARNGQEAVTEAKRSLPDLIVRDIMMPQMDGIEACRIMRTMPEFKNTFMVFLTARSEEYSEIAGFNVGADDYISKPFSLREVVVRVKAVIRRGIENKPQKSEHLIYKNLSLNLVRKRVTIDGSEIALTKKEFEILFLFLSNIGRVFSREEILTKIWSDEVYVLDRTIDVNITRLRRKIGVYGKCVVTRLGYGYCFEPE